MATVGNQSKRPAEADFKGESASDIPPELLKLGPPGLLGRLDDEQREALLVAVKWQHDQPPNPTGKSGEPVGWVENGRWAGPKNVPGPLRGTHVVNRVCKSYLEEGILLLHVRERKSLKDTARKLGYSYRHILDIWSAMRRRALSEEGEPQQRSSVRDFVLEHLEKVIEVASEGVKENAAYGMVLIRACEALKEIYGTEEGPGSRVDVQALAEAVRGRSPLLLEVVEHATKR